MILTASKKLAQYQKLRSKPFACPQFQQDHKRAQR